MTREHTGIYCGVRRRLRGERAMLLPAPGGWRVQFNDLRHRESHYWWYFPSSDFTDIEPLGAETLERGVVCHSSLAGI